MRQSKKTTGLIPWLVAIAILLISALLLFNVFNKDKSLADIDDSGTQGSTQNDVTNNPSVELPSQKPLAEGEQALAVTDFKTGEENLPRSLKGTTVDGDIIIDENNKLVPTRGLRRLYDYFLSALGEETSDTIDARVEAYITSRTPEPAASTAVTLYYTYKNYLTRLSTMQDNYGNLQLQKTKDGEIDLNLIKQRHQDIIKIRNELFEPETAEAFFGSDDELEAHNIAVMEISQNPDLTDEQRKNAIQDYQSRLPDSTIKQRIMQKQNFQNLMERTEQLKAQGATKAELFAMRSEMVGVEAAQRLSNVDDVNQAFDDRFNEYTKLKQQIEASDSSEASQQAQIQAVEQRLFNETERKRLTGYALLKSQ